MSVMANVLPAAKRAAIVSALTEGCSIRSTARMVGVSRNTVTKLLLDLVATSQFRAKTFNDRIHGTL